MKAKLDELHKKAHELISEAASADKLEEIRVSMIGKKGEFTTLLKGLKDVAAEERPVIGALVNEKKEIIENLLREKKEELKAKEM